MKSIKHSIHFTYVLIIILTALMACEDSTSIHDTATQDVNQVSGASQQQEALLKNDEVEVIEGEYIIIFRDQFGSLAREELKQRVDQLRDEILSSYEISKDSVIFRYNHTTQGFLAKLSDKQVEALKEDARIARIKPNILYKLGISMDKSTDLNSVNTEITKNVHRSSMQSVPWGVLRVGGPMQYESFGKRAWVIDSGVDLNHPDLNVDVNNSDSFIPGEGPDDLHGHGTHVAGIIAATGNSTNVFGVAPGVSVVAVKVCYEDPPQGEDPCPLGSILAGIEYVDDNANPGDVANISIWGPVDPDLDDAVLDAADNGVRFTLIG